MSSSPYQELVKLLFIKEGSMINSVMTWLDLLLLFVRESLITLSECCSICCLGTSFPRSLLNVNINIEHGDFSIFFGCVLLPSTQQNKRLNLHLHSLSNLEWWRHIQDIVKDQILNTTLSLEDVESLISSLPRENKATVSNYLYSLSYRLLWQNSTYFL